MEESWRVGGEFSFSREEVCGKRAGELSDLSFHVISYLVLPFSPPSLLPRLFIKIYE